MTNISDTFSDQYRPYKALLIYQCAKESGGYSHSDNTCAVYVESYDIGKQGNPINPHPLTIPESITLAGLLQSSSELQNGFLRAKGIIPGNVLYLDMQNSGYALWYTPPQERSLFFVENLNISCGKAFVPAMLWKASRDRLQVFALKGKRKPTITTKLYHAPYFNIYADGAVCMGTVSIRIDRSTRLEDFMAQWEKYFFGSYFSHGLAGGGLTETNIVQLWQQQVDSGKPFQEAALTPHTLTFKSLIP
ncbi:PRTRC system protein B [Mucilaginibacter sp. PAMB04274]|uniref:PRTRC system protein B n=1 Tax=Mucilaginibacter sp. PAMB04274 TaxID=3138568 RepID=UPI0031F6EA65